MDFEVFREKASYLSGEGLALVEKAYEYAQDCHQGQQRESGGPYLEHPLAVAVTLAELALDASSLAAGLLHDVSEDCGIPMEEIEARFGEDIARLVDGVTKLSRLPLARLEKEEQAENLRKLLVAMAQDLRVVFIKLADRLHNMKSLQALPPQRQKSISQETMEVFAPLAHRLGIWQMKWQLEDLAFSYLEPEEYGRVADLVDQRRAQREALVSQIAQKIREELGKAGLEAEVSGRPKHLYSIFQKMKKYSAQGRDFSDIHDLLAVRVIVNTIPECYGALGVIHSLWHPFPGEFDDYIANPKPNGYQSLHTAVMCEGAPLEVQVRTREMHRMAEYGVASHWGYKEGRKVSFQDRMVWLRQLLEWQREFSRAEELVDAVKTDIFQDQVFVFTPKGEVKELPQGATPVDFAYRIHTELGQRCVGAKVNGRLVPLNYTLKMGDTVEVLAAKRPRGPSRDWLNLELGYVKTSQAREKIKQWFKRQERQENIERGRPLLEKEMKRLGLVPPSLEELARLFGQEGPEDFLAAIGYGAITPHQVALKLDSQEEKPRLVAPARRPSTTGIQVLGVGDLLTRLANCCQPLPGDPIVGYITRSRGVTVHRLDCYNILHEDEKERLVPVEWGERAEFYPVSIHVEGWDRVGLLRDISTVVAEEKMNITSASVSEGDSNTSSINLIVETRDMTQLSRLLARIEGVRGVTSALRSGDKGGSFGNKVSS